MQSAVPAHRRLVHHYRQDIEAAPDRVFPLICPVREAEWLAGWHYAMLYSQSGLAEAGAVFSTPGRGEPDTTWVITRHDATARIVQFTRFTPDLRTCVLDVHITPAAAGRSFVEITYTYTALSAEGEAFLAALTREKFLAGVMFWEQSMNHWLRTGQQLQPGS
mgnify:CR=1 FL=1